MPRHIAGLDHLNQRSLLSPQGQCHPGQAMCLKQWWTALDPADCPSRSGFHNRRQTIYAHVTAKWAGGPICSAFLGSLIRIAEAPIGQLGGVARLVMNLPSLMWMPSWNTGLGRPQHFSAGAGAVAFVFAQRHFMLGDFLGLLCYAPSFWVRHRTISSSNLPFS